jgi:hypothetical protein
MRVDVCAREDYDTLAALLAALEVVGARPVEPDADGAELGAGLHRFRTADGRPLTVFVDAWGVDLEGPDELVNRVTEHLAD